MKLNEAAKLANTELFRVCGNLESLLVVARNELDYATAEQFAEAVKAVRDAQCRLRDCDLVIDAARDPDDQSYTFALDD